MLIRIQWTTLFQIILKSIILLCNTFQSESMNGLQLSSQKYILFTKTAILINSSTLKFIPNTIPIVTQYTKHSMNYDSSANNVVLLLFCIIFISHGIQNINWETTSGILNTNTPFFSNVYRAQIIRPQS